MYIYVCVHTYAYIRTYVFIYVCIYTYMHKYMHTDIQKNAYFATYGYPGRESVYKKQPTN